MPPLLEGHIPHLAEGHWSMGVFKSTAGGFGGLVGGGVHLRLGRGARATTVDVARRREVCAAGIGPCRDGVPSADGGVFSFGRAEVDDRRRS